MELEPRQFASAIEQICEEKGIPKEKVMETVEKALASAYRKDYGQRGQNIEVKFDEVSGNIDVFLLKEVVETFEEDDIEYLLEHVDNEQIDTDAERINTNTDVKNVNDAEKNVDVNLDENGEEIVTPKKRFNEEAHIRLQEARKTNPDIKVGETVTSSMPKPEGFGRIAAQNARQVIIQRIREAEREAIFAEYDGKEGEIASGIIQRIERGIVYVDLGRTVGMLYPQEQIREDNYRIGSRIKILIMKVESDIKDPAILLSRAHQNFVAKLFEMEVPEILSESVVIKGIAREAGLRTKIAVVSTEDGVDPIGSCVGQRGTRVQTIINELNGEKIDIIEWNDNPKKFIANSLSPAKILNVEIANEEERQVKVEVQEDQLSLAIGKQGQNVRLAAKLTGWKIDVFSKESKKEEVASTEDEKNKETDSDPASTSASAEATADKKKESENVEDVKNKEAGSDKDDSSEKLVSSDEKTDPVSDSDKQDKEDDVSDVKEKKIKKDPAPTSDKTTGKDDK
ncbi:transcription termination/antitermination protein NusA [bacterium]|nr:MAG: transcription termination/antitermination protein NusA [bacterium]